MRSLATKRKRGSAPTKNGAPGTFDMLRRQDYLGERRLYADGRFQTDDGRAKLIPVRFVNNNECPDAEYPFWLNSGRVVEHFHTRTRTGKIGNCHYTVDRRTGRCTCPDQYRLDRLQEKAEAAGMPIDPVCCKHVTILHALLWEKEGKVAA